MEMSIQDYRGAIHLDPQLALAHNSRGNAYKDLGQYEKAIQGYNEAIRLDPQLALAYNNRGAVYMAEERTVEVLVGEPSSTPTPSPTTRSYIGARPTATPPPGSTATPTPVPTPTPPPGSTPTPTPPPNKIAFRSDRDGNWEIYVMNADGSGQTRLTTDSDTDHWPE
ncbi:MAG: tetratricopeptide repeat protein [Chloroflexi bacterium]|nr:tetratricopeptide repeat protein [Chloroflexota bacterium]